MSKEQKELGVYYTSEDITTYISTYTILPYLIDATLRSYPVTENTFWSLLRTDPDRYIYAAVKKGCDLELPSKIMAGIHNSSERTTWNQPATLDYALPTETWREVIRRRQYYKDVRALLAAGKINTVLDLVVYNLDIQQFTLDGLTVCQNLLLLLTFFAQLRQITILDPTCGSGAFLITALHLLTTLHETCFQRFQQLVAGHQISSDDAATLQQDNAQQSIEFLYALQSRTNMRYHIQKYIMLNNLYGVDIMAEAIESCQKLFLRQLAENMTQAEDDKLPDTLPFHLYHANFLLGTDEKGAQSSGWLHVCETIEHNGGYAVIIGNPPYRNLHKENAHLYSRFATISTGNLYPLILERCQQLIAPDGRQGYIVPISSMATKGYADLQKILQHHQIIVSSYDDRPSHLFSGLNKSTLSILLLSPRAEKTPQMLSTRLCRWNGEERAHLFTTLRYYPTPFITLPACMLKIGSAEEAQLWQKLFTYGSPLQECYTQFGHFSVYYSRKINAFVQVLDFIPEVRDGRGILRVPSEFKVLSFATPELAAAIFCCLNSTLFRWFIDVVSDGSHLNRRDIDHFPLNMSLLTADLAALTAIAASLSATLCATSETRVMHYRHDTLTIQCIIPKNAKSVIDTIDHILARHYHFSPQELDFILNYDIKYRMRRIQKNATLS